MILECDIGNTACKWRIVDGAGSVLDRGYLMHAEQGFELLVPSVTFDRVRALTVAGPEVASKLTVEIKRRYSLDVEWAKTSDRVLGVNNAYRDVSKLGVDRWAVVVAAYQAMKGPVMVIDAGSAMTVDVVNGKGVHLGGYIVPGMNLMKSSLLKDTKGVRFADETRDAGVAFGVSTDGAVHAGVRAAMLGVVMVAQQEAERLFPQGCHLFLTGGDGETLRPYLNGGIQWQPDLVLDGLKWLLP